MPALRDSTVRMPDGRQLAYTEWGVADGRPVMFFHGTPGGRLWCPDEEATSAAGVRLICPDRPGVGGSDVLERRTISDWPKDVVALADALGLSTFGVIGCSGGGTSAAACAALIPERLRGAALVVSSGPTEYNWAERPGAEDEWTAGERAVFDLAQTDPAAAAKLAGEHFAADAEPWEEFPAVIRQELEAAEGDRWFYEDASRVAIFEAHMLDWRRQGWDAVGWELIKIYLPWGFRLADITIPVSIFHGAQDPWVTQEQIDWQAKTIPNSTVTVWDDAGHLGFIKHFREILDAVA
jgi:pimeloyl-ACP methyl ester carboxylesterase